MPKNIALSYIEDLMVPSASSLKRMPNMLYPNDERASESTNMLIHDELNYERKTFKEEHGRLFKCLTIEQRKVYETIIRVVDNEDGGVFFVYCYEGTGKTFIWKKLAGSLRSKGEIVINVASSGIASLVLIGGGTAHSRFGIPINLNEDSGEHVIEVKIITGSHSGDIVHIPRMKLVPSDRKIPFRLQRRQFPIAVCFAMTINKRQRQSLFQVGLFLKNRFIVIDNYL